ncbi:MAG: hypothetical protein CVV22_08565 [Ignavibacteriae bacterium HGW-Ignavibacteriae-1]|jgi:hypothetical protein|nr:MAG: hypothetical protein CVV22_08565 [Ignavibacteriae bacterium HGW-Ignavibacteriae-1]
MEKQKIQLKHPQGKKAVSISRDKFEILKTEIVKYLTEKTDGTFSEISKTIAQDFKEKKIKFDGSLNWYLEWVKLDLEARQIIKRVPKTAPQKYILNKLNDTDDKSSNR